MTNAVVGRITWEEDREYLRALEEWRGRLAYSTRLYPNLRFVGREVQVGLSAFIAAATQ